jgi:alkylation response protein AidB-like acyl-CoA dehydrogenase
MAASATKLLDDAWVPQNPSAESLEQVCLLGAKAGWFELDGEGAVPALLAIAGALGRAACPIPVADAHVATQLLPAEFADEIRRGTWRVAVVPALDGDEVRGLEAAAVLTHVLVLGHGSVDLHPLRVTGTETGTARPEWGRGELGEPLWSADPGLAVTDAARTLLRLALAARATGGATRLHELAVAHAKTREQFGRVIGTFGAVQQRTATAAIAVAGAGLLLRQAAAAREAAREDWELTAELAVRHIAESARAVLLAAHHTLGAVGYFSEHVGPWLFRRVHADLAQCAALLPTAGTPIDRLVEGRTAMLAVEAGPFRTEVRAVIDGLRTDDGTFDRDAAVAALVDHGWLGMAWPPELGGRSAPLDELAVLQHEFTYARVPVEIELASVLIVGDAIVAHGTPAQQQKFLPLVREGRMRFCLGYSEPETGSDLAALRTRATRVDGGWRINGQKIWTTRADVADYIWLAARTDPDATPRHAGITLFVVPTSTPGVTINPMTALSGETAATVFLDDVLVGDDDVIGEVNGGWAVITSALAGERVLMGAIAAFLQRVLDDVIAAARPDPEAVLGPRGSAARDKLDSVAAELAALHGLVRSALGDSPQARLAAPMAGVLGGELAERVGGVLLDVLGPDALRTDGLAGRWPEYLNRLAPMYVIGGGTNDIQRGLIARGLGLPR